MERIPDHPVIRSMERTGYPANMYGWTDPEDDADEEDDDEK